MSGSLLDTADASNVPVNLPVNPTPSAARAETDDKDDDPAKLSSDPESVTHNHPQNHQSSRIEQMHSNQEVTIARGNGRFTIDNICIIRALSLMFKNFTTGNVWCQCAELQNLVRFLAHSTEFMSRPVTELHRSSPQAYAGRNSQGGSTG